MTTNEKILISTSLLPVLADFLEDAGFRFEAKNRANVVINSIRALDRFFMNDTNTDEVEQQNNIQLAFRQWCNENFKEDGRED